jgi:integrase
VDSGGKEIVKTWELSREDLMTPEEWGRLRSHLEREAQLAEVRRTWTAIQDRAICYAAVWSGLRRAELAALNVGDLFLKNDRPYLVVRHGKGDKYRSVAISPSLRVLLKRFLAARGLDRDRDAALALFRPQRGERYTADGIYRVWKTACKEAGIPPRSIHKARHLFGQVLYEATEDLRFVQKQLGHSRITTTQVYVEISAAKAEKNLKLFDRSLLARAKSAEDKNDGEEGYAVPDEKAPAQELEGAQEAGRPTEGLPGHGRGQVGLHGSGINEDPSVVEVGAYPLRRAAGGR